MANRYWVGGTGTWNTTSTTNWSANSGGSSGASVPTAADAVFFDQAGTYTVTMTGALNCLDITVSAGSVTFATGTSPTLSVAGNVAITAGTTTWSSTGTITFTATTSKTITSGGTAFDCSMTLNGVAGTWTLQDNLTLGTSSTVRTFTVTNGTMALGSYTLSCHAFNSNNSNTRTLDFGTGKITTKASTTTTIWNIGSTTGLTVTGSRTVEITGGGGAAGEHKALRLLVGAQGLGLVLAMHHRTGDFFALARSAGPILAPVGQTDALTQAGSQQGFIGLGVKLAPTGLHADLETHLSVSLGFSTHEIGRAHV